MDAATARADAPGDVEDRTRPEADRRDRARAQAHVALRKLYAEHAARLTRRAALMVGNDAAAQDVVQETFVLAFERGDELAQQPDAAAWLWGVARNKLKNHTRKQRRRRELWRRFGRRQAQTTDDASHGVAAAELQRRLDTALSRLSQEEREAFVVRHIEQLSLKEASVELGLSISTLSARARRAADKIRAHFEEASR